MASQSVDNVYKLIMGNYEQAMNAQYILTHNYTKKNDDTKIFLNNLRDKLLSDLVILTETESDDYWKVEHFNNGISNLLHKWK